MLRLVKANVTSAGKTDLCDRTPSRFFHVCHADTLLSECDDLGFQIVTHEKEFVPLERLGGMNGHFRRRQREDQPAVTGVHRGKSEDVPAEGTISRSILAVDDDMGTKDHERSPSRSKARHENDIVQSDTEVESMATPTLEKLLLRYPPDFQSLA